MPSWFTWFAILVLMAVLAWQLRPQGHRRSTPPTGKAYPKSEIARLQALEGRLADTYVETQWGPDYDKWGPKVLEAFSDEDLRRLKEWYEDAYVEFRQQRTLDTQQFLAKAWVTHALVMLSRVEGQSLETPEGAAPNDNTA
ncbi:hypothetical protein [Rothia uropygialis]|uniref:hypothetical protein n=1 Tax=Kocuria sp. 36 TaxID=1415402 RepID=UPI00101D9B88|nr:hypothetical protein [Kocuria sp. 36]